MCKRVITDSYDDMSVITDHCHVGGSHIVIANTGSMMTDQYTIDCHHACNQSGLKLSSVLLFPVVVRDHIGCAVQLDCGGWKGGVLGARQHVPQWMDGDLA